MSRVIFFFFNSAGVLLIFLVAYFRGSGVWTDSTDYIMRTSDYWEAFVCLSLESPTSCFGEKGIVRREKSHAEPVHQDVPVGDFLMAAGDARHPRVGGFRCLKALTLDSLLVDCCFYDLTN